MSERIVVTIIADTRAFRRGLALLRLALERSWWRRQKIRWELLRIRLEKAP